VSSGVSWNGARNLATKRIGALGMRGYLATITSKAEQQAILDIWPDNTVINAWFGASDEGSEGDWQWITGETFFSTSAKSWGWSAGNPS